MTGDRSRHAPQKQHGDAVYGDGGNRTHVVFPASETVCLPLRDGSGTVTGYALVDAADSHLAQHTWSIDARTSSRSGPPYVRRGGSIDGKRWSVSLHREVLGLERHDRRRVDHINGDPLDNRKANLRLATTAENAQNQGSRGGSSQYRGVTWDKSRQKWMATAMLDGRRQTIGRFDSEGDAGAAAAAWRAEHMPFSAEATA